MNLTLFFRLIMMSIFQKSVVTDKKNRINQPMNYDTTIFRIPRVYAKDGFNVSLQAHNCNYCASENGYRELGHTMEEVEFGFPSENEELMHLYSEDYEYRDLEVPFNITEHVGIIPVSVMEAVFEKHGGIDWEKTISIEHFNQLIKP
jgi:hypothetical protein